MRLTRTNRLLLLAPSLAATLCLSACNDDGDGGGENGSCGGGKCDEAETLREELGARSDVIARFLLEAINEQGQLETEYLAMLEGIAGLQGCDRASIDSYVISDELVVAEGDAAFPRVVNTVCSSDRTKADLAFFALSFANADGTDVSTRDIEMFAWDDATKVYNFYKATPAQGSESALSIEVEPAECTNCHLTPDNVDGARMHMTPIMNELAAPWEHWFAEPVSFNHSVPSFLDDAPNYQALTGSASGFRKSASRLEQSIRSAFNQRVAIARLGARRNKPADLEDAMALMRPLFCDEQLTYVTEDGSSGLLAATAVVDDGWHSVFFQVMGTGWEWEWWNDRNLRLDPPGAPDAVNMMPVRGASVVAYEKQLMSFRALQPEDVARIRALDWHNPTMSDFRCGLYENAVERFRKGLPEGVESGEDTRTLHLMRDLFPHILTVHPGDFGIALEEPVSLTASEADHFIAFASADDASIEDLVRAVADGSVASSACGAQGVGMCEVTLPEMGAMIEDRFKAVEAGGRDFLNARRNTLACKAVDHYESVPHIPGTDCENPQPEPDPAPEDPEPEGGTTGGPDEGTSGGPEGGTTGGPEGGTTGGMGADAGNCCEPRDAEVGCEQSDVQACVCAEDSFCCETAWDQQCVDLVDSLGCTPGC